MKIYLFLIIVANFFELVLNTGNFYETLNVANNATIKEIKSSYKKLALKFHPDKNNDPKSKEIFQEINLAYHTLNDEVKRKDYDLKLKNKKSIKTYYRKRKNYSNEGTSSQPNAEANASTSHQNLIPIYFYCILCEFVLNIYHDGIDLFQKGNLLANRTNKIWINGGSNKLEIYGNNLNIHQVIFGFSIQTNSVIINIFGADNKLRRNDSNFFNLPHSETQTNNKTIEAIINGHSNTFKIYVEYTKKSDYSNAIEINEGNNNIELYGRNIKLENNNLKITKEFISFTEAFTEVNKNNKNDSKEKADFNFGERNNGGFNFGGDAYQNFNFGNPSQAQTWNFGETSNASSFKTFNFFPEEPSNFGGNRD
ncbi:J domain-containing protein [Meloidogyne graminicola]|uniref:DnaJ homolog subfamily B member 9 n=1 Tax=Meloidogyne graminicola TaxID=189291 RepID=A0A8S9ZFD5_9BILA|nr:J domain-containing protein [Meloidogyne graminicola]